jgi:hypothetical protein
VVTGSQLWRSTDELRCILIAWLRAPHLHHQKRPPGDHKYLSVSNGGCRGDLVLSFYPVPFYTLEKRTGQNRNANIHVLNNMSAIESQPTTNGFEKDPKAAKHDHKAFERQVEDVSDDLISLRKHLTVALDSLFRDDQKPVDSDIAILLLDGTLE